LSLGRRAIVLGSAAGGGFPQWNCRCRICTLAWAGDPRVCPRTQSSLALTGNGTEWLLVNASPDIRQQIGATPELWPQTGDRHSPITSVVLTNAEIDGCAGLLTLRERQPFRLFATGAVHAALDASPVFEALDRSLVERVVVAPNASFEAAGLTLRLVPMPGKAPLYAEGDAPEIGIETGETTGLLVEGGGAPLAYLPGCAGLTETVLALLDRADPILFDGTLFTDNELVAAGLGAKTGTRMGHVPISGPGGSLDVLSRAPARRKVYVHINNTNPILVEGSPERREVEAAGIAIAHDGLEIAL
jgi:pyrroloquinoline quinone biosynthesis protein B